MAQDESTYGFSKTDATELVQLIGGGDREYTEGKVRSSGGGGKIYAFQITSTRTGSNPAYWTATILDPTDQSTVLATGVTLWGNYLMFDDLTTNDNGICGKYGADFVIVNAPCGA